MRRAVCSSLRLSRIGRSYADNKIAAKLEGYKPEPTIWPSKPVDAKASFTVKVDLDPEKLPPAIQSKIWKEDGEFFAEISPAAYSALKDSVEKPKPKYTGRKNEFKQPVGSTEPYVAWLKAWNGKYWTEVTEMQVKMGYERVTPDVAWTEALLEAINRAETQSPEKPGSRALAILDIIHDWNFVWDQNPTVNMWNSALKACTITGEWRLGAACIDAMLDSKLTPDPALVELNTRVEAAARKAGLAFPPKYTCEDLNQALALKKGKGGQDAAYVRPPKCEVYGFNMGYSL